MGKGQAKFQIDKNTPMEEGHANLRICTNHSNVRGGRTASLGHEIQEFKRVKIPTIDKVENHQNATRIPLRKR